MAIKPSSDIVLEVLKAADPARAQAVTQRLVALGAGEADAGGDFTKALDAAAQPASNPRPSAKVRGVESRAVLFAFWGTCWRMLVSMLHQKLVPV